MASPWDRISQRMAQSSQLTTGLTLQGGQALARGIAGAGESLASIPQQIQQNERHLQESQRHQWSGEQHEVQMRQGLIHLAMDEIEFRKAQDELNLFQRELEVRGAQAQVALLEAEANERLAPLRKQLMAAQMTSEILQIMMPAMSGGFLGYKMGEDGKFDVTKLPEEHEGVQSRRLDVDTKKSIREEAATKLEIQRARLEHQKEKAKAEQALSAAEQAFKEAELEWKKEEAKTSSAIRQEELNLKKERAKLDKEMAEKGFEFKGRELDLKEIESEEERRLARRELKLREKERDYQRKQDALENARREKELEIALKRADAAEARDKWNRIMDVRHFGLAEEELGLKEDALDATRRRDERNYELGKERIGVSREAISARERIAFAQISARDGIDYKDVFAAAAKTDALDALVFAGPSQPGESRPDRLARGVAQKMKAAMDSAKRALSQDTTPAPAQKAAQLIEKLDSGSQSDRTDLAKIATLVDQPMETIAAYQETARQMSASFETGLTNEEIDRVVVEALKLLPEIRNDPGMSDFSDAQLKQLLLESVLGK